MSDPPRLLFCCFDVLPGPTGLSRRVTEYLKGLADRFQVVVLSTKTPDHSHIERYQGARLLRVPVGSGDLQSRIQTFDRAVRRQLESEEYVIAHFFDPFGGYALCESRSQYGFRLVYDAQSFPSQELRYNAPAVEEDRRFLSKVRRQELYCLMNADAVICGSEVTRDWVLGLGAPPLSLHVFHQPVELSGFGVEAVGQPDGTPMKLIYLGSQLPYQGLPTLLRALQLALRHADMRLSVVGPKVPDGQPPYDDLVAELKLAGKVEFLPPVPHDDLPKALALADVGLLPLDESERNRAQAGPLAKVGEYLAAGRPVVAADLPVSRELLPAEARCLFPPGDFKALAEILVQLASDPARRLQLGRAARAGAVRFDASAARGKLLDLYGTLSTRGKVGASESTAEVTELRKTGSSDTGRGRAPVDERPPGETIDEEPPVVVGRTLLKPEKDQDRLRAAVTEPATARTSGAEATPLTPDRSKVPRPDEPTPIGPSPAAEPSQEPTPITSARGRKVISKSARAVKPSSPSTRGESKESPPSLKEKRTTAPGEAPSVIVDLTAAHPALEPRPQRNPTQRPSAAGTPSASPRPAIGGGMTPARGLRAAPNAAPTAFSAPPKDSAARPRPEAPMAATSPGPKLRPHGTDDAASANEAPDSGGPVDRPADRPTVRLEPVDEASDKPVAPAAPRAAAVLASLPPHRLPPPPITRTDLPALKVSGEELPEASSDDVQSVDDDVNTFEGPLSSVEANLNPWLAQLLFGYCPPEAVPFVRPPPPTTFPGRE